ncbi:hypothetical protein ACA910_008703 [Epithemia clementina (nom. ined.)]
MIRNFSQVFQFTAANHAAFGAKMHHRSAWFNFPREMARPRFASGGKRKNFKKTKNGAVASQSFRKVSLTKPTEPAVSSDGQSSFAFKVGDRVILQHIPGAYSNKQGVIKSLPKKATGRHCKYEILLDDHELPIWMEPGFIGLVTENTGKSTTDEMKKELGMIYKRDGQPRREVNAAAEFRKIAYMKSYFDNMSEEQQQVEFGRPMETGPNLQVEYFQENRRGFPKFINQSWATRHLLFASERSVFSSHVDQSSLRKPDYKPDDFQLNQRLGVKHALVKQWYLGKRSPGDLSPFILWRP